MKRIFYTLHTAVDSKSTLMKYICSLHEVLVFFLFVLQSGSIVMRPVLSAVREHKLLLLEEEEDNYSNDNKKQNNRANNHTDDKRSV